MCMICYEYQKGLLTFEEAMLNTEEMSDKDDHKKEIILLLMSDEDKYDDLD